MQLLTFLAILLAGMASIQGPGRGTNSPSAAKSRWVVQKSSSLCITGHTNINRFTCGVPQYTEQDTLCFLQEGSRGSILGVPLCGTVRLNINDFDCHNRTMTGEFKTTVLAGRFPQLKITFVNLERLPSPGGCSEAVKGWVEIELAGTCRLVEIDYTAIQQTPCTLELDGTRTLAFHDFALEPPQKMGGLIKVNDTLEVHFTLYLKQID